MNRSLFPTKYEDGFDECWRLYKSRCESANCSRKDEAYSAWLKTRNLRPELPIMLRCIALYLDQVELGRRVVRNGRDEKVTYFKLHFSTFLGTRKNGWMDFVEQATQQILLASQAPSTPQQKLPERRSFTAAQYATPENLTPLKPRQQIIEEARLKRTSVVER